MFVHLHVHSCFSFLDGASRPEDIVRKASELGMPAVALTDHDNVSGMVRFVKTAKAYSVRPIIGAEVTLCGGKHITLLCKDKLGFSNLCSILTRAHMESERKSPAIPRDILERYSEGLFVLTGCRKGEIPSLVLEKRYAEAFSVLNEYKRIFGRDSVFVELSETRLPGSLGLNKMLSELAEQANLHTVATNNVHYASKDDFPVHDVLTCVRTLTTLEEVHPERRLNAENYLKSEEEMREELYPYPEAVSNAAAIAAECECPVELGKPNFPRVAPPKCFGSTQEYLRHLVFNGARERYGVITRVVQDRLEHELSVIQKLGYEDYFLVVWDLVRFACEKKVRHAGRGSAADSAVAYCLGITDVDPVAQNLLFERFLSVERGEKPDIDVDFDYRRRDEVTSYAYERYGREHVACVATFSTFQGRSALRDVGKVMGYPEDEIDLIAKRVPHVSGDMLRQCFDKMPELKSLPIPAKKLEKLLDMAERISGLPRFLGTHLGGIVITGSPITEVSPLEYSAKGSVILQFDKDDVEDLGLVKIDLLSLRTMGAIEDSLALIGQGNLDYEGIPLDDQRTYQRLKKGDTVGVFQLESPAQRALQSRLGAENIEDVVASVALIRPGPIKGNMVEPFIRRRSGEESTSYILDELEPILKKTYGVVLFQEQVIEIASKVAGFTPGEADNLRRVMTHARSYDEMQKIGELFVCKAVERGVDEVVAAKIFDCVKGYASYGFCEAHARAFGTTAYKTAYLIEHYPAEFFAAILSNQPMGFYPVSTVCVEARRHGVKILGPSVNKSRQYAFVEDGAVRLPLKMVSGLSETSADQIVKERERNGIFASLFNFAERTRLDKDALRSLILCGAMDEFGSSRRALLWELPDLAIDQDVPPAQGELLRDNSGFTGSDFTLAEKIAYEFSILGTGISGHPCQIWRGRLEARDFVSSRDLPNVKSEECVKVGGIPVRPHRPPTKSGKTVVFLSLEDEFGLIDVTCFENIYKRFGKFLFPGEIIPLGIWGEVQRRGNGVSVVAHTVFPLSYVLGSQDER